jgi:CPA2 family monovalent cation:H+ antiporter-2
MLLGESPFATQIRADIGSVRIIMVTLFFASVGMMAKPLWFLAHLHWVVLAAGLIFVVKTGIIYGVCRLFGLNNTQAIATGITLGQIGEFSFVLAATAKQGGVLDAEMLDLIVSVIIVLMLATPYMIAAALPLADRLMKLLSGRSPAAKDIQHFPDPEPANRVLVVGLGPAGRQVAQALIERNIEPIIIDINPQSRNTASQMGVQIHLGDARHEDILMHSGLSKVCMVVVTIPDTNATIGIIQMVRHLRPELTIAVRCRYNRHLDDLEKAGADQVVDEEATLGQILSQKIIDHIEEISGCTMACRMSGRDPEVMEHL